MGNFAENLNLGNRFRPPLCCSENVIKQTNSTNTSNKINIASTVIKREREKKKQILPDMIID